MFKPTYATVIQIAVVLSFLALAGVMAVTTFSPPKMKWVSVAEPMLTATKMSVRAEAVRLPADGCSNGPQIELQRGREAVRLPVPTRTISGDVSVYETELVRPLDSGWYKLRLRETFVCRTDTQVIDSPWIVFEVTG